MYVLVEEHNDWMDYITTTDYTIHKVSNNKEKLEEWAKANIVVYSDSEWDCSNHYEIKKVEEI